MKSCTLFWSLSFLLFLLLINAAHAGSSLWLSDWSKDYKKLKFNNGTSSVKFNKYERLAIYSAFEMSQYILNLFCEFSYLILLLKSAKYMQATMLSSILRSKMQWFESTPVGRIINRFSKDIQVIESLLPNSYRMVNNFGLLQKVFKIIFNLIYSII